MNANELRIGNFITTSYSKSQYYYVTELCNSYCHFQHLKENFNSNTIYVYIDPIELTEEWLVKLGFKWNRSKTEMSLNNVYAVFHQIDWNIEIFYYTHNVKNIKYVHQLQNLYFALTNEELTLKK